MSPPPAAASPGPGGAGGTQTPDTVLLPALPQGPALPETPWPWPQLQEAPSHTLLVFNARLLRRQYAYTLKMKMQVLSQPLPHPPPGDGACEPAFLGGSQGLQVVRSHRAQVPISPGFTIQHKSTSALRVTANVTVPTLGSSQRCDGRTRSNRGGSNPGDVVSRSRMRAPSQALSNREERHWECTFPGPPRSRLRRSGFRRSCLPDKFTSDAQAAGPEATP